MDSKIQKTILSEAASWRGTPYSHSHHEKHIGTNCLRFVGGVYKNVGLIRHIPDRYYDRYFFRRSEKDEIAEGIESALESFNPNYTFSKVYDYADLSPGNLICLTQLRNFSKATHAGIVYSVNSDELVLWHILSINNGMVSLDRIPKSWKFLYGYSAREING